MKTHKPHKPHSSVPSVPSVKSDPSDRFKFRVWDKEKKYYAEMIDDDSFILNHHGILLIVHYNSISGQDDILWPDDYGKDHYLLEFCTGLIDKHGQLIYEGDIIRFDGWPGTPSHIVAWNPRTCRWVLRLPKDINLENTASLCLGDVADNEYIIIGNIHQSATPSSAPSVPIRTNPYPSVSVRAANQEPLP